MPLWGYQKTPAPSWWACLIKGEMEANVRKTDVQYIHQNNWHEFTSNSRQCAWYKVIVLELILLMCVFVCVFVCVRA